MYVWLYFWALSSIPYVYLFGGQYHAVLITVTLKYSLKSGSMIPLALFFFLRIALAIQSLSWFCIIFCSISLKNVLGILIGIALNL